MRTSTDIRNDFFSYFEQRGHTFVPSSGLMLADDPTLLFANAGMNQFKSVFLGAEVRPYNRAYNSQKCMRAGGKHNDLDDVGHDCSHLTFFEMLGNWSFGDYFKRQAIQWAWEMLTGLWGLDRDRLYVTVFAGDEADALPADDEARDLWAEITDIDPSHIIGGSREDNFWEPGETGPCGPCSEIHIDLTEDGSGAQLVNASDPRVIEIWNLVFMQFNRGDDGSLSPLPARHVDTGMGFERLCMALQGKKSLYAIDQMVPLIGKVEEIAGHSYGPSGAVDRYDDIGTDNLKDVACRAIADHARALTFAIADGVVPGNEGRGYVLRRILRRAARYGRQYLALDRPFLADIVPTVVELMGEVYPEIARGQQFIVETVGQEERSFARTLDRGLSLFAIEAGKIEAEGAGELPGETAFKLYETFGFPIDLTRVMAVERGLTVDMPGYDRAMSLHRELSQANSTFKAVALPDVPATDDRAKYHPFAAKVEAKVLGWVVDGRFVTEGALAQGAEAALVLDKTSFYGEQGGQVGDTGVIMGIGGQSDMVFEVTSASLAGEAVLHQGSVKGGRVEVGMTVCPAVSGDRWSIMKNHTATHLLNWALRKVLGEHVNQAGSVVAPGRLRFDFLHTQAMTHAQCRAVELEVNGRILADEAVRTQSMPLWEARRVPAIRAIFGEKYPDPVRVMAIGLADDRPLSEASPATLAAELCGGTHVDHTAVIGLFKIISEESVAKGVRRIIAITGLEAVSYVQGLDDTVRGASQVLQVPADQIAQRVEAMQKEIKSLRKAAKSAGGPVGEQFEVAVSIDSPAGRVLIGTLAGADVQAMRAECDRQRQKGAAAVLIGSVDGGKVMLVAMVSDALVDADTLHAGQWIKEVASVVGGGGGGKARMAQAGGKDPAKLPEALEAGAGWVRDKLA